LKLTSSQELKMTIGELVTASGLPASTIRYWEKIGVLPKPVRAGGQRRYSVADVQRLAVLRLAQACGFRLDEMRHLLHGYASGVAPPRRWHELARRKQDELDEQIARLRAMRQLLHRVLECRCIDLAECARIAASAGIPA
jgi:MerR family transcriptional regulator, redox-sensitive transcriptional activator SoxR